MKTEFVLVLTFAILIQGICGILAFSNAESNSLSTQFDSVGIGENFGISEQPNNVPVEKADSGKKFVGSINSNKYHYPNCGAAKNIHPENAIWFTSSEDARNHGYVSVQTM